MLFRRRLGLWFLLLGLLLLLPSQSLGLSSGISFSSSSLNILEAVNSFLFALPQLVRIILYCCIYVLSVMLIFYGLRFVRYFIILYGVIVGAVIGACIGVLFGDQGTIHLYSIGGSLLLGLLAWPLHKLFIFIAGGMFASLSFLLILTSLVPNLPGLLLFILSLGIFYLCSRIASDIYDYFVICTMSVIGTTLMLYNYFVVSVYTYDNIDRIFVSIDTILSSEIGFLALMYVTYAIVSLCRQKVLCDTSYYRDILKISMIVVLVPLVLIIADTVCKFSYPWLSSYFWFGYNLFDWGLVAIYLSAMGVFLKMGRLPVLIPKRLILNRIAWCMVISMMLPMIKQLNWLLWAGNVSLVYYGAMFRGNAASIANSISHLIVLPMILYFALYINEKRSISNESHLVDL